MGRTVATITMFMQRVEHGLFGRFVKSLPVNERRIVTSLFARAHKHLSAINMTGHMLPFETVLLAMQHEQQKEINELRQKLRALK